MAQTHEASGKAAEKYATANGSDVSRGESEELTALRAIVEAASHSTGEEYFQAFVRNLARLVDARYAFIAEFASPETTTKARTIAFWARDHIAENFEWTLAGTPCEEVVHGNLCHHPSGVRQLFPDDRPLVEWGIESYLGVPLRDPRGTVFGHVAVWLLPVPTRFRASSWSRGSVTPLPDAASRRTKAASRSRLILTVSGRNSRAKVQSIMMRKRRAQPGICSR